MPLDWDYFESLAERMREKRRIAGFGDKKHSEETDVSEKYFDFLENASKDGNLKNVNSYRDTISIILGNFATVRLSWEYLEHVIIVNLPPKLREEARMHIVTIFLCAKAMGSLEPISNPPLKHYLSKEQSAIARRANEVAAEKRTSKLEDAIAAEVKERKLTLAVSIQFAELIRPGVRNRLGKPAEGTGYPSASTIKSTLANLKTRSRLKASASRGPKPEELP